MRQREEDMNANELADSIATCEPNLGRIATDCADMIRQQQAEIEALKKVNEEARKYARYLSNLCSENDMQIIWYF